MGNQRREARIVVQRSEQRILLDFKIHLTGFSASNSTTGSLDISGPFFQKLGTNGRTCATCHAASDGFGLSAADAKLRSPRLGK